MTEKTVAWFKSYLSNREQCVAISNTKSTMRETITGIPQGSVLGPILFSMFINDLPDCCQDAEFQMYADDAVLYVHGKTAAEVSQKLNDQLEVVALWLNRSCLALNVNKTVSMCFSSGRRLTSTTLNIEISNKPINQVTEVKYLGLVLDEHLKFDKHIKKICKTVRLNSYTYRLIRDCLSYDAAKIYLHSMILSHIGYCTTAWSQASLSAVKPLERLYNRALKILGKRSIRTHHCNVQRDLNMLSFHNYIALSNVILVHKCLHGKAPQLLCDNIQPIQVAGRSTRNAVLGNCRVPHRKTVFGQSSFLIKGTNQWNSLPSDIKAIHNHEQFKTQLKEFLKSNQVCSHV